MDASPRDACRDCASPGHAGVSMRTPARDGRASRVADRPLHQPGHDCLARHYTAARRQFGNPSVIRLDMLDMNSIGVARASRARPVAMRAGSCARSPGFAAVVAATLGVGIGGTTAVFSVVQAVLVAPLPYEQPGQLVRFFQQEPGRPDTRDVLAGTHFTFLRDHAASFEDVAALAQLLRDGPRPGDRWPCRADSVCCGCRAVTSARSARHPALAVPSTSTMRPARACRAERSGLAGALRKRSVNRGFDNSTERRPYEVPASPHPGFADPIAPGRRGVGSVRALRGTGPRRTTR